MAAKVRQIAQPQLELGATELIKRNLDLQSSRLAIKFGHVNRNFDPALVI